MMDAVEQIKSTIPLEDVVSETVSLKPAGRERLAGLCPFHSEKTASFHVMTDKRIFYCHGCQASGDVFTFVQQTQGVDFRGALELLAARAGIVLPERRERSETRDLFDLQKLAQDYFLQGLKDNPCAREYLIGRGFTAETITKWGFGFAPDGWHGLIAHARNQTIQPEMLERAGLAKSKDSRFYDVFRNRVTIPIKDAYGRIVGFSARTLGDDAPKYLNTPETDIFKKGDLLFGLTEAKATIRKSHAVILVEGQLDTVALHQAGFTAAVGAQSAALTEAQIGLLERLEVNTLYPAYDADAAGQRATLSALDAVARTFICKVVRLPGKDPADTVMDDPEAFRRALRQAKAETHYRLEQALTGLDITQANDKQKALERLKSGLRDRREPFDPVAGELRHLAAERLGIDERKLTAWANKNLRTSVTRPVSAIPTPVDVRYEIVALSLNDPGRLHEHVERIESVLSAEDTLLTQFVSDCKVCDHDVDKILQLYQGRTEMVAVFAELVQPIEVKKDLLGTALNRYLREQLPPGTEVSAALAQALRAMVNPGATAEARASAQNEAARLEGLMALHVALR